MRANNWIPWSLHLCLTLLIVVASNSHHCHRMWTWTWTVQRFFLLHAYNQICQISFLLCRLRFASFCSWGTARAHFCCCYVAVQLVACPALNPTHCFHFYFIILFYFVFCCCMPSPFYLVGSVVVNPSDCSCPVWARIRSHFLSDQNKSSCRAFHGRFIVVLTPVVKQFCSVIIKYQVA